MAPESAERIRARAAAAALLEDLGLEAFAFEVEGGRLDWRVDLECASADGWTHITLSVPRERLMAVQFDSMLRRRLAGEWRERLAACRRR